MTRAILMLIGTFVVSGIAAGAQPTPQEKIDTLIARLTDAKVSWAERCTAEDDLVKLPPEQVLPRLLKYAARKMPAGGIYNSGGREHDKNAPLVWQIHYAVHRSWSALMERLPAKSGGAVLLTMLGAAATDRERTLLIPELRHRWTATAEEPLARLLADAKAPAHLRVSTAWTLVQHGKKSYQDLMLFIFDEAGRAAKADWLEVLTCSYNKRRTGVAARVVARGYRLLLAEEEYFRKEPESVRGSMHGGYFSACRLGDYLGEKFQPDHNDPRYNNAGRRDPRWFADVVANAVAFMDKNRERYKIEAPK